MMGLEDSHAGSTQHEASKTTVTSAGRLKALEGGDASRKMHEYLTNQQRRKEEYWLRKYGKVLVDSPQKHHLRAERSLPPISSKSHAAARAGRGGHPPLFEASGPIASFPNTRLPAADKRHNANIPYHPGAALNLPPISPHKSASTDGSTKPTNTAGQLTLKSPAPEPSTEALKPQLPDSDVQQSSPGAQLQLLTSSYAPQLLTSGCPAHHALEASQSCGSINQGASARGGAARSLFAEMSAPVLAAGGASSVAVPAGRAGGATVPSRMPALAGEGSSQSVGGAFKAGQIMHKLPNTNVVHQKRMYSNVGPKVLAHNKGLRDLEMELAVLKSIKAREDVLDRLRVACDKLSAAVEGAAHLCLPPTDPLVRLFYRLVGQLRSRTLDCVETLAAWHRRNQQGDPFLYYGSPYMRNIGPDLQFLDQHAFVRARAHGLAAVDDPFVLHITPDSIPLEEASTADMRRAGHRFSPEALRIRIARKVLHTYCGHRRTVALSSNGLLSPDLHPPKGVSIPPRTDGLDLTPHTDLSRSSSSLSSLREEDEADYQAAVEASNENLAPFLAPNSAHNSAQPSLEKLSSTKASPNHKSDVATHAEDGALEMHLGGNGSTSVLDREDLNSNCADSCQQPATDIDRSCVEDSSAVLHSHVMAGLEESVEADAFGVQCSTLLPPPPSTQLHYTSNDPLLVPRMTLGAGSGSEQPFNDDQDQAADVQAGGARSLAVSLAVSGALDYDLDDHAFIDFAVDAMVASLEPPYSEQLGDKPFTMAGWEIDRQLDTLVDGLAEQQERHEQQQQTEHQGQEERQDQHAGQEQLDQLGQMEQHAGQERLDHEQGKLLEQPDQCEQVGQHGQHGLQEHLGPQEQHEAQQAQHLMQELPEDGSPEQQAAGVNAHALPQEPSYALADHSLLLQPSSSVTSQQDQSGLPLQQGTDAATALPQQDQSGLLILQGTYAGSEDAFTAETAASQQEAEVASGEVEAAVAGFVQAESAALEAEAAHQAAPETEAAQETAPETGAAQEAAPETAVHEAAPETEAVHEAGVVEAEGQMGRRLSLPPPLVMQADADSVDSPDAFGSPDVLQATLNPISLLDALLDSTANAAAADAEPTEHSLLALHDHSATADAAAAAPADSGGVQLGESDYKDASQHLQAGLVSDDSVSFQPHTMTGDVSSEPPTPSMTQQPLAPARDAQHHYALEALQEGEEAGTEELAAGRETCTASRDGDGDGDGGAQGQGQGLMQAAESEQYHDEVAQEVTAASSDEMLLATGQEAEEAATSTPLPLDTIGVQELQPFEPFESQPEPQQQKQHGQQEVIVDDDSALTPAGSSQADELEMHAEGVLPPAEGLSPPAEGLSPPAKHLSPPAEEQHADVIPPAESLSPPADSAEEQCADVVQSAAADQPAVSGQLQDEMVDASVEQPLPHAGDSTSQLDTVHQDHVGCPQEEQQEEVAARRATTSSTNGSAAGLKQSTAMGFGAQHVQATNEEHALQHQGSQEHDCDGVSSEAAADAVSSESAADAVSSKAAADAVSSEAAADAVSSESAADAVSSKAAADAVSSEAAADGDTGEVDLHQSQGQKVLEASAARESDVGEVSQQINGLLDELVSELAVMP